MQQRATQFAESQHVVVLASIARSLINFRGPMLKALRDNGHRVTACAPDRNPKIEDNLRSIGIDFRRVNLERTGLNPVRDLGTLRVLYELLSELEADVFLAYTIKPVIYGSLAARWAGIDQRFAMITGLGYAFGESGLRRQALNRAAIELYRLGLAGSNRVFFQNPDDLALFEKLRIVNRRQAVLVNGSGVDLARFAPAPFCTDVPSFLLIARLIAEKGVVEYVKAAREVKKLYPSAIFRLAGALDGTPRAIPKEVLDGWQEEGLIEYLGLLEDVRPALAACNVYVLPSYYREGTPRTVLEAMAVGRPIITTDAPGCRETVRNGENGFLVPPRDAGALAEAMIRLAGDQELARLMGSRSLELVREKYDVHAVNAVILEAMGLDGSRLIPGRLEGLPSRPVAAQ
jgi:glycosyltransferase involved in cell wall biosynthesis